MSFYYSKKSKTKLSECEDDLQLLMERVILYSPIDIRITWGFRGEEDQNQAYKEGASKFKWPKSGHNKKPSQALDFEVLDKKTKKPIDQNKGRQYYFMIRGIIEWVAIELGIELQTIIQWDLYHVELKRS